MQERFDYKTVTNDYEKILSAKVRGHPGSSVKRRGPGIPDLAGMVSRRKLLREYYKKAQKEWVKPFFFSMN